MEHGNHEGGHHGEHAGSHEKHSGESFMAKHRKWLNGSFGQLLKRQILGTIGAGALLTVAGVSLPMWMVGTMVLPYNFSLMMTAKKEKKDHGHEHAH